MVHWCLRALASSLAPAFVFVAVGCAASINEERQRVQTIAEHHMDCPGSSFVIHVDDEDMPTRQWTVRCEYQTIRVSCTRKGCSDEVERVRLLCTAPAELRSNTGSTAAKTGDPYPFP